MRYIITSSWNALRSNFKVRWNILILMALSAFLTSLISIHLFDFPTQQGLYTYQFPFKKTLALTISLSVVCLITWIVLIIICRKKVDDLTGFIRLYSVNGIVTLVTYSMIINLLDYLLGFQFDRFYFEYLIVFMLATSVEVAYLFLMGDAFKKRKNRKFYINDGYMKLKVDISDILVFKLQATRTIKVYLAADRSLYTQYNSLSQISKKLDSEHFFRLNRQFLVSKKAISHVVKGKDRNVNVILKGDIHKELEGLSINVSRYNNVNFSKWYFDNS